MGKGICLSAQSKELGAAGHELQTPEVVNQGRARPGSL